MRRFLHSWPARLMLAATLAGAWLCASSLSNASAGALPLLTYISGLGTNSPPSVWIADADGTSPTLLGQATSALLSPDGTQVAALNKVKATSTLSLYPVGGGSPTVLTRAPQFMQLLAWSADAKLLLVLIGGGASGQLVVFDVATHTNTTVASGVFDNASFQPGGSDQVVYALADKSSVNLFIAPSSGLGHARQLTHDGHSEYPLWGHDGIVYSRAKPRGAGKSPTLELWTIKPNGTGNHQLASMAVPSALSRLSSIALTPIAFSASGGHLLANLVGPNYIEAYVLDLTSLTAKKPVGVPHDLTGQGNGAIGDAISARGDVILLTKWTPGSQGGYSIETAHWNGGKPTLLVKSGAYASWDR